MTECITWVQCVYSACPTVLLNLFKDLYVCPGSDLFKLISHCVDFVDYDFHYMISSAHCEKSLSSEDSSNSSFPPMGQWKCQNMWQCMYLGLLGLHCLFSIPGPAPLGKVVDCGKLNEGGEDEGIAHCNEPVHGSSVSHFRQRISSTDAEGGHGKHCCHTWGWGKQSHI